MADRVVLWDLPILRDGKYACFSFNPWKARLVLNYKNIPYRTEWSEYPDLEPKLKALGVPPNPTGSFADYTSPTVQLPDGSFVSDSTRVAPKLESLYPEPSLHLDAALHDSVADAVEAVVSGTIASSLLLLLEVLPERSSKFFAEDRAKRFGMPLEDLAANYGGDPAWQAAEAPGGSLEQLLNVLTKHRKDEGPFVLGSQVSYGDFIVAGLFESYKTIDSKAYERLISFDKSFKDLHEACQPWLQRDDH